MNTRNEAKPDQPTAQPRCIRSHELFDGQNRVRIVHEGVEYLLQITRHGKLILTK
jgi:hemin uptake protein HemP